MLSHKFYANPLIWSVLVYRYAHPVRKPRVGSASRFHHFMVDLRSRTTGFSQSTLFTKTEAKLSETNQVPGDPIQTSDFDLESLAKLCSVGAVPIPNDLPDHQQKQLLKAIAVRRRKRLLNLFAAAIADDIWREQQTRGEPKC